MRAAFDETGVLVTLSSGRTHHFDMNGGRTCGDSAFAASLPVATALGEDLEVASVSEELLANYDKILSIYESWGWGRRIRVRAATEPAREAAAGIGVFFTGGVDSTFSALRHPEITHLIYVAGYELRLDNPKLRAAVLDQIRHAAGVLGKELIVLETDLRSFSDHYVEWERYYGAALGFAAHSLKDTIGRVLIASGHLSEDDLPRGSHFRLDPLWSSGDLEVIHDGADITRTDKTIHIADHPEALEWLRVCWLNPDDAYNCGRCEKCLRTMLALEAIGAQGPTFPPLDPKLLAKQRFREPNSIAFAMENIELLETSDRPELLKAMRRAMALSRIPSIPPSIRHTAKRNMRKVFRRARRARRFVTRR